MYSEHIWNNLVGEKSRLHQIEQQITDPTISGAVTSLNVNYFIFTFMLFMANKCFLGWWMQKGIAKDQRNIEEIKFYMS